MRLTRSWRARTFVTVALALAACSTKPAESAAKTAQAQARHSESGLPVIPLTVTHGSARHSFRVEVARDRVEQARGLMFRTHMGADEGMIFPMDPPRPAEFWMKNTVIPLDIIFIGPDRRILNVAANAVPYSETPISSAGPTGVVLELNAGRAAALGIAAGDRVSW